MANDNTTPLTMKEILQSLSRLEETLRSLPDKESAPQLSHYRIGTLSLQNVYALLHQSSSNIHAGSTKFALLSKLDAAQATAVAEDSLLPPAQWLVTACLILHQDSTGAANSLRTAAKQAARAVLRALEQLLQVVKHASDAEKQALEHPELETLAAQRTGAVWEACQRFMDIPQPAMEANATVNQRTNTSMVPFTNRLAIRRDLLNYVAECNETLQEFQDMIDAGPCRRKDESDGNPNENDDEEGGEPSWEHFLGGGTDQYTRQETSVATAALALVKCSRGCVNVALQACDDVGQQITEPVDEKPLSDVDQAKLQWIARLYDCAQVVGEGMTDLGAAMYPPIKLVDLEEHVRRQSESMHSLLSCVLDTCVLGEVSFELGRPVKDLANKLLAALSKRTQEANDALAAVLAES